MHELALVGQGATLLVKEKRGSKVNYFESADGLRALVIVNDYVIRFQVTMYD